jgi:hypothetical protein
VHASPVQEVPVARAIYEKQTINLDSWDEATQVGLFPAFEPSRIAGYLHSKGLSKKGFT